MPSEQELIANLMPAHVLLDKAFLESNEAAQALERVAMQAALADCYTEFRRLKELYCKS